MNAKRTLRLRREVLTALANDELAAVAAADAITLSQCYFSMCFTCLPAICLQSAPQYCELPDPEPPYTLLC